MTTANLAADLRRDEGCRLQAYPDPVSGGAPWTIGFGHAGLDVHPGLAWTLEQAQAALAADVAAKEAQLDAAMPWWRKLDDIRQDSVVNLAFNLGVHGLSKFGTFLDFMRAGKFAQAALDLSATPWAKEVGARAKRIIVQIRTGIHQA